MKKVPTDVGALKYLKIKKRRLISQKRLLSGFKFQCRSKYTGLQGLLSLAVCRAATPQRLVSVMAAAAVVCVECSCVSSSLTLDLAGKEEGVDVGEDTAGGNGGVGHKLVELLVVADGELNVAGHNSGLLVVLGGVSGELEDLSGEVLEDGSEVHGGTSANSLGEAALLEEASDSANGELESSLG
ncbi:hypothetical protein FGO68_gene13903 [Halteria grandinella]|uniref:Uncharacterized protein n=1 Tax=Halteria grandinella TaxID=5974 RepID=A0A8J8P6P1_HALGN|nr:hypothetical protein FGO68_gene13903 [Halteria grandinella]